ncbi:RDD family protein [Streptomyces sp. NPDC006193]|uniref:RDD family protein n=1 Tax=Streptomyces sp. NPDC006193 TaxID=3155717 RepID=UPI0033BDACFB
MSAPTPAPGDDRPREGYYPDPSIPGYVRYWNGASWVPGTSRPAPRDGETLAPPPGARPAAPSVEETGPHFFDEDPVDPGPPDPGPSGRADPADQWVRAGGQGQGGHGGWAPAGQGGQTAQGAQWGRAAPAGEPGGPGAAGQGVQAGVWPPGAADPRVPAGGPAHPDGNATSRTDGTATIPPVDDAPDPGTFVFRRPVPGPAARADDGTRTLRPAPDGASGAGGAASGGPVPAGFGTQGPVGVPAPPAPVPPAPVPPAPAPSAPVPAADPGFGAGKAAAARATAAPAPPTVPQAPQPFPAAAAPALPQQPVGPQATTPLSPGSGGGQASWAQQVHRLAGGGDEQPVAPWKPPVEDPFQAAARRQAAARPAGLGRRFAARLIDLLAVGAVTAAAAVPLGVQAVDHVQGKIEAARLSGRTVTVWLIDGTTGTSLGIVLAVLLLAGVLYEVLPTVKWGRTLGKKLCGIEVRDIEAHEPPTFGPALRRWLVLSVPGLLAVGIVGVLWCLFDRPWRQCWHDKAAHTFVAG